MGRWGGLEDRGSPWVVRAWGGGRGGRRVRPSIRARASASPSARAHAPRAAAAPAARGARWRRTCPSSRCWRRRRTGGGVKFSEVGSFREKGRVGVSQLAATWRLRPPPLWPPRRPAHAARARPAGATRRLARGRWRGTRRRGRQGRRRLWRTRVEYWRGRWAHQGATGRTRRCAGGERQAVRGTGRREAECARQRCGAGAWQRLGRAPRTCTTVHSRAKPHARAHARTRAPARTHAHTHRAHTTTNTRTRARNTRRPRTPLTRILSALMTNILR
jgi:hypothetical protein